MYNRDIFHKARTLARRSQSFSHASSDARWGSPLATAVACRMVAYMGLIMILATSVTSRVSVCPVRSGRLGAMAFAR